MKNTVSARFLLWISSLALMFLSPALRAEDTVSLQVAGIAVTAEFRPGSAQLPAIILLHGFLQTREFPTVKQLADGLTAAGYATLAPTLSLGIPRRSKSLACEAVHRHTLAQDVNEIAAWIGWLAQRHAAPIVFIGHSYGSLQGLVYAAGKPHAALRQIIALSLVDTEQSPPGASKSLLADARARVAKGNTNLADFAIGHCKKFTATPGSYLSYANWDRKRVLDLARRSAVPVNVVMGGNDDRMGKGWAQALAAAGVKVDEINGANHFFDMEHEFDLLDLALSILKKQTAKR